MHLRSFTTCCLSGLMLAIVASGLGCRRRDPYMDAYVEVLNAEKRDLEDQIYELEDELATTREKLEAAEGRVPKVSKPRASILPKATPAEQPKVLDDADLSPPMIDLGVPAEPKIELPPAQPAPVNPPATKKPPTKALKPETAEPEPMPEPMPEAVPDDAGNALAPPMLPTPAAPEETLPPPKPKNELPFRKKIPADAEAIDPQVSRLFINPFHTTGIDTDQQPGDDAIKVLFEPRNAAERFVPLAGEVSIVLLDPAKSGEAARVARWDLSKQRVGEGLIEARPQHGIQLELPWPDQPPQHGKLTLFVRYTSPDGQTTEASSDIFVSVAGQLSQRWTPRHEKR